MASAISAMELTGSRLPQVRSCAWALPQPAPAIKAKASAYRKFIGIPRFRCRVIAAWPALPRNRTEPILLSPELAAQLVPALLVRRDQQTAIDMRRQVGAAVDARDVAAGFLMDQRPG